MWNEKTKTFKAPSGSALAEFRLVRPSATTAGEATYPAAGYKGPLFITLNNAEAGKSVTCVPIGAWAGTFAITVAGAVARGARLFLSGAAGKVDDAPTATPTGLVALEAATADGEQIEVAMVGAGAGAVAYANLADSAQVEN